MVKHMLIRRLQKQRENLFVNIPASICKDFGWEKGDYVQIAVIQRGIIQIQKINLLRVGKKRSEIKEKESKVI